LLKVPTSGGDESDAEIDQFDRAPPQEIGATHEGNRHHDKKNNNETEHKEQVRHPILLRRAGLTAAAVLICSKSFTFGFVSDESLEYGSLTQAQSIT
jgi:hypothetical protein